MTNPSPDDHTSVPDAARMYDYYLGGRHNFEADRRAADEVLRQFPSTVDMARSNRAWLGRVVRYLVGEAGIHQILDLGSGLPTVGNVHEIAQQIDPSVRVVYVDVEQVASAYSAQLLAGKARCEIVQADIRDPHAVLEHPTVRQLLDFAVPVAVVMSSILPFIPEEDHPAALVAAYRQPLTSGSYLAISHASGDGIPPEVRYQVDAGAQVYDSRARLPVTLRSFDEVASWFTGLEMVHPGVVALPHWLPTQEPEVVPLIAYGGVGRVP